MMEEGGGMKEEGVTPVSRNVRFWELLVPVSAFSPPLEAADKAKKLIFNRIMKRVKFFKFSFADRPP